MSNIDYIDIYGNKKTQFTCHFVIVHALKAYVQVNKKTNAKKSICWNPGRSTALNGTLSLAK